MSDLKDLNSRFDINNIDINQIIEVLTRYLNTILKLAVVLGALVIAWMIFNDYRIKEQDLRLQMSQVQQKLDVIAGRQKAIGNLENLKSSFQKGINEDKIINQITSYATAHGVSISSLSPAESQEKTLYDVIRFDLSALAPDFQALVLFLRDIEKSKYFFMVDSWSLSQGGEQGGINFSMGISVVRVHL